MFVLVLLKCTVHVQLKQELLRKATAAEKKKIRAEKRVTRALDDKFPTAADAPNDVCVIVY